MAETLNNFKQALEAVLSVARPNFTQIYLALKEVDADKESYATVLSRMEDLYKLEHFDPAGEPPATFNAMQLILAHVSVGQDKSEEIRHRMEANYKLSTLDIVEDLDACLDEAFAQDTAANITHFSLRLQELGAVGRHWQTLRALLEKKSNTGDVDQLIESSYPEDTRFLR